VQGGLYRCYSRSAPRKKLLLTAHLVFLPKLDVQRAKI